jgi:methyl-accepting chemotaxis protein
MRFNNRNRSILPGTAYAAFATLFVACLGVGSFKMKESTTELARINDVNALQTTLIAEMRASIKARVSSPNRLARLTDREAIRAEIARVTEQERIYADATASLGKTFDGPHTTPEVRALFEKLKDTEHAALPLLAEAEWLAMHKSVRIGRLLAGSVKPQQAIWLDALDDLARSENKRNADAAAATHAAYQGVVVLTLLVAALPLAAALFMLLLARRPLRLHPEARDRLASRIAARADAVRADTAAPATVGPGAGLASTLSELHDRLRAVFIAVRTGPVKPARKARPAKPMVSPQTEWPHSIMSPQTIMPK